MTTLMDILDDYANLAKRTLRYKDIERVKTLLSKEGFKTSKIQKYKGLKRFSAINEDNNTMEVIFGNKYKYCIYSTSFSNQDTSNINVVSTNKKEIAKEYKKLRNKLPAMSKIKDGLFRSKEDDFFSPEDIFLTKNIALSGYRSTISARKDYIFNLRNIIYNEEIPKNKKTDISDLKGERKRKKLKKIVKNIVEFYYHKKEYYNLWEQENDTKLLFEKEFVIGYFILSELYLRYNYTEEELNKFLFEDVKESLEVNISEYIKDITNKELEYIDKTYTYMDKKHIAEIKSSTRIKSNSFERNMKDLFFEKLNEDRVNIREKLDKEFENKQPSSDMFYELLTEDTDTLFDEIPF